MMIRHNLDETEEERRERERKERLEEGKRQREAAEQAAQAEGKAETGHSGATEAAGEWDGLNDLETATEEGMFKPDEQAQEIQENEAVLASMTASQENPWQPEEEKEEQAQETTETEADEEAQETPEEEKKQSGAQQQTGEEQEQPEKEAEQPEGEKKKGYEYNGQVYGNGELDLSQDPVAAIAVMHSGGMNALTEATIQAMNEWAEESDGIKAVLGILTDENMEEYATIGENGELIEKNNRNAHSIFISNCGVLGSTLSRFAMKLNDSDFPPELYGDAVGVLMTIVEKAEEAGASEDENVYEEYIQNNKESKEMIALANAFGFCDELFTKKNGLDETMNAAIEGAQLRCREGKGTEQDYALLEAQVPDLTDDEKEKDLTYSELISRYDQEDKSSYEAGNEDSWLNQQTVKNLTANGYEPVLTGIEAASYKDIMLDCRREAADMVAEYAHKMGYSDMGAFMKETGFTEEMLDELALRNYRAFEKTIATPENAQALQEMIGSGEEGANAEIKTEADLIEVACRGFGAGVVGYMKEGFEAFYTWTQSTNIPTDSARVRNKYTTEYGIFGGERELYNELMEMSEEGFFPNEGMNKFVKDYLEEGGNPFLLGIVPGEYGWVAKTANNLNDMKEVNDEWAEGLSDGEKWLYDASSWLGGQITGIIAENEIINPGLNWLGLGAKGKTISSLISSGSNWYNTGYERGIEEGYGAGKLNAVSMAYTIGAWIGSSETVFSSTVQAAYSKAIERMPTNKAATFFMSMANAYEELPEQTRKEMQELGDGIQTVINWKFNEKKAEVLGNAAIKGSKIVLENSEHGDKLLPSDELVNSVGWLCL